MYLACDDATLLGGCLSSGATGISFDDRVSSNHHERGARHMAFVEGSACSGCFVSVTSQTMNELINARNMSFCMSCGRILYLAEEDTPNTRRSSR